MTRWEKLKDKLKLAGAYVVMALTVLGTAVATVVFYLLPKRDEEQRRDARQKAEGLKAALAKAQMERQAQVDQKVAVVKEETKEALAEDPVDFANVLIEKEKKS